MNTDIADLIAGVLGVSRGTAYDMMREALAVAQQQEPVAWMVDVDLANYQGQSEYRTILAWNAKPVHSGTYEINEVLKAVPLYTSPPASKPLTDEEIYKLCRNEGDEHSTCFIFNKDGTWSVLTLARAIEAAHGITGEQK